MVDETVNGMVISCVLRSESGDVEFVWSSLSEKVVFGRSDPLRERFSWGKSGTQVSLQAREVSTTAAAVV